MRGGGELSCEFGYIGKYTESNGPPSFYHLRCRLPQASHQEKITLLFFHFCPKDKGNIFFSVKNLEKKSFFCKKLPLLEVLFFQFLLTAKFEENKNLSQVFAYFFFHISIIFLLERKILHFVPQMSLQRQTFFSLSFGKKIRKWKKVPFFFHFPYKAWRGSIKLDKELNKYKCLHL